MKHIIFIAAFLFYSSALKAAEVNEIMAKNSFSISSKKFMAEADLSNPGHLIDIAEMYYTGNGVAQNSSLALMWLLVSDHMGAQTSNLIKSTAASMAPDQITKARALAQNWINNNLN